MSHKCICVVHSFLGKRVVHKIGVMKWVPIYYFPIYYSITWVNWIVQILKLVSLERYFYWDFLILYYWKYLVRNSVDLFFLWYGRQMSRRVTWMVSETTIMNCSKIYFIFCSLLNKAMNVLTVLLTWLQWMTKYICIL